MRSGRLHEPTGDLRADAIGELRRAMAGAGLTIEKLLVMESVLRLPEVARATEGADRSALLRVALDTVVTAANELEGLRGRILRNALAIGYGGSGKDLTARRLEFIRDHNDAARRTGSRNFVAETTRALYTTEQQMIEALVTALGAPPGGPVVALDARRPESGRSPRMPLPRQLPAATAFFSGRSEALGWLDAHLPDAGAAGVAPTVLAVSGTAGVGKTALALQWAHRAADRFPDGQLYVDLRGHSRDGDPLPPATALSHFVLAFGVPPESLPVDEGQLAGVYRSVTAGKRLLVVLDNAATAEQVRALVPGEPGCVVLVTSRNALPALTVRHGAQVLTLNPLPPDEAEELLVALVGADRTNAEPVETVELAARCAFLPLALRIVAAKLQAEPHSTVADLATRLSRSDRLTALELGDDSELAVRAAFDLSYGSLSAEEQRAFRFLGIVPGADVGHEAVAALLDVDPSAAGHLLDRLAAGHLIGRPARMRYQFHDLIRDHASALCHAVDDEAARGDALARLFAYYVERATDATTILHPRLFRLPPEEIARIAPPAPLGDREAAMGWLEAERANLVEAVVHASTHGPAAAAWQLADAMRGYFLVRPCGADWLTVGQAGLDAATRAADPRAESAMHNSLGRAYRRLGNLPAAVDHLGQALVTSQAAEWLTGEAVAHCVLGGIFHDQGRLDDAITHHQAALDVERRIGDPNAEAAHLGNIGFALLESGAFSKAVRYFSDSLKIFQRVGDARGIAVTIDNLGALYHQVGRSEEGARHVTTALGEHRRLEFPDLEAESLNTLARICRDTGDLDTARRHATESLRLARLHEEMRVEVLAMNTLGTVSARSAQPDDATGWHERALEIARRIGYRHGAVDALAGLASAAVAAGDFDGASTRADAAIAEARLSGFRALEAQGLAVRARAAFELGDDAAAEAACDEALAIHRASGCRLGTDDVELLLATHSRPRVDG